MPDYRYVTNRDKYVIVTPIRHSDKVYAHQMGHHVERRFGWDCHGLPVEYEIDKTLGIKVGVSPNYMV